VLSSTEGVTEVIEIYAQVPTFQLLELESYGKCLQIKALPSRKLDVKVLFIGFFTGRL